MISLRDFKEIGLSPNWTTLLIGWNGPKHYSRQLTLEEIQQFSEEWLGKTDQYSESVSELMFINDSQSPEIEDILKELAKKENGDLNLESRKWRYVLAKKLITQLNKKHNYLNGLFELTDFWAMFDFPDDSPHMVQGRKNEISPINYYTEHMFFEVLEKHKVWLKKELKFLQSCE